MSGADDADVVVSEGAKSVQQLPTSLQIVGLNKQTNGFDLIEDNLAAVLSNPKIQNLPAVVISVAGASTENVMHMLCVLWAKMFSLWSHCTLTYDCGPVSNMYSVFGLFSCMMTCATPVPQLTATVPERFMISTDPTGPFRLGKSFLLNYFLKYLSSEQGEDWLDTLDQPVGENGFSWAHGSTRDTTGIWMYRDPIVRKRKDGSEVAVILVDTQGTFDNKTSSEMNAIVFALNSLISSVQVRSSSLLYVACLLCEIIMPSYSMQDSVCRTMGRYSLVTILRNVKCLERNTSNLLLRPMCPYFGFTRKYSESRKCVELLDVSKLQEHGNLYTHG